MVYPKKKKKKECYNKNCLYLIFGTEWYSSFINSSNSLHGVISMKLEFLELKLHVKHEFCKLEFQKQ